MHLIEELLRVVDAFAANKIEYAVCGGLALAIHGRPRLTVDIDILIAASEMERSVETVAKVGFDDVAGWVTLPPNNLRIDRLYRLNKISGSEFLTLDLLEADSAENAILADRETFEVDGRLIQSLSRGALITMKRDSQRTKDKLDIELLNDESD